MSGLSDRSAYYQLNLACLAMRNEPSHRAEMCNQILRSEVFSILDQKEDWIFIELHHDQYRGWIEKKSLEYANAIHQIAKQTICISKNSFAYPFGCFLQKHESNLAEIEFLCNKLTKGQAISLLKQVFLDVPYLWGGRTTMGIDCSGLIQLYARILELALPRDAKDQIHVLNTVSWIDKQIGDLVFFQNEKNKITHVGIYIGEQKILHASGKVRIDHLSEEGIISSTTQNKSHPFHSIGAIELSL
ncbi:MAG TPA: C40 family peptidase [Saprospiraceae bacterium]|nr:C40 family peptidase [Saprospiraceae bacterium]